MTDDTTDTEIERKGRHLALASLEVGSIALGLKVGDELVAVNGLPFDGSTQDLRNRFGRGTPTIALTFQRDERKFVVLSRTPNLGQWKEGREYDADEAEKTAKRILPEGLINWEVYQDDNGNYDLQTQRPSTLAIALTPLWFAQMRLWTPLAIWAATIIVTVPIGIWVVVLTQALAWSYFWNTAPEFFRRDRIERGMTLLQVIAAKNEQRVHLYMKREFPEMRFVYEPVIEEPDMHEAEGL